LKAKPILPRAELEALPQAALRELFESVDLQGTYRSERRMLEIEVTLAAAPGTEQEVAEV
jgi:hypothetical protein